MGITELLYVVIALVVGLGVLILVHEVGHFVVARWAGVHVETFSIGFGRPLVSFRRGATEYKIAWIPLGGYVKMAGEDPEDTAAHDDPGAYSKTSVHKRMAIVLAGPTMNLVLACLIMPLVFLIGRERPTYEFEPPVIQNIRAGSAAALAGVHIGDRITTIDGVAVHTWEDVQERLVLASRVGIEMQMERAGHTERVLLHPSVVGFGVHPATFLANDPIIDRVMPGSAAERGGMQAGDRVLRMAGQPIAMWDDISLTAGGGRGLWFWLWAQRTWQGDFPTTARYVRGGPLLLEVQRAGVQRTLTIEPQFDPKSHRSLLGVSADREKAFAAVPKIVRRYGLRESVTRGEQEVWRLMRVTGEFLTKLVRAPKQHYESLGGPVQIISMFAKIAKEGVSPFLYFLCFLSLQLGMLNLLPIPVLDGGHLFFMVIEAVRRKPVTVKIQTVAQQIGLAMLLSVFVLVTINDLGHFEWIRQLIGRLF